MRGLSKTLAMLALAGGFSVVPSIGSQGAGALGELDNHADSRILRSAEPRTALDAADRLAARAAVELTRS
jgi:hypothetical protein